MKTTTLLISILLLAMAGCSYFYDIWPASIPKDTQNYSSIEPNQVGWQSIGKLKELRESCITKNIITQTNLATQMSLDKALYGRAISQANFNITTAEAERSQIVGTLSSPGWLLSLLLPAAGIFTGRALTQLTYYSEAELQTKLKESARPAQT